MSLCIGVRTRVQAGLCAALLGLSCASAGSAPPAVPHAEDGVVRYRLLLESNPVDTGEAFRCYGHCQSTATPEAYLACLEECPGFEVTSGIACTPHEVPPVAACFTARPKAAGSEPDKNLIVIAVIADVALVVGLAAVCASQDAPCSYSTGLGP
jgi:hypothetical protein